MNWAVHPINQLPHQAEEWDKLVRSGSHPAFLESAFLLPLLEEFGSGRELVAVKQEYGSLRAGVIVSPCRWGRWQTFQPSQIPLGVWIGAPNFQLDTEMRGLMGKLPGPGLTLGLTQVDSILHTRPQDNSALRTQDYIDTAWVDVVDSFDDYWEARGKNLRQNSKKQRSKLTAEGTPTSLECLTQAADVELAMRDYGSLESAGWKAADGTAIHPDNAQGRFYRKMLENFCALGRGRIYRYRFGDKVVSMDLCIESGPVLIILKTAYDESYKSVSPSSLMRQDQFRQIFEEGHCQRIEFYGKVMEWHTRWTTNVRPIYHVTRYRWPFLNSLHARHSRRSQAAGQVAANA